MTTLYTFSVSHFGERARWALDHKGVDAELKFLLPGPHIVTIKRIAKLTTIPVLEHRGHFIQGSRDIIEYVENNFDGPELPMPDDSEAEHIQQLAEDDLAKGLRKMIYTSLLAEAPDTVIDLWTQNGPWWGRAFYKMTFPVVMAALRRTYNLSDASAERAHDRVRRGFDELDAAIDGREYYFGDRFSQIDLTVAALIGHICRPEKHPIDWPKTVPAKMEEVVAEHEGRPCLLHAQRMYDAHR